MSRAFVQGLRAVDGRRNVQRCRPDDLFARWLAIPFQGLPSLPWVGGTMRAPLQQAGTIPVGVDSTDDIHGGHPPRPLRDRGPTGRRRHGRGVSRARPSARTRGGGEGAAGRPRVASRSSGPIRARGKDRRRLEPSEHRHSLLDRGCGRDPVSDDGTDRGGRASTGW